MLKNIKMNNT